jgi:hypothetical protein
MFNFAVKENAETFKEYIINAFRYTLKDTSSNYCHNYMLKFPNCIYLEFIQTFCKCHKNIQNDVEIYMELKNMKQEETKRVEVYYKRIPKLVDCLQVPTTDNFFTIVFRVNL